MMSYDAQKTGQRLSQSVVMCRKVSMILRDASWREAPSQKRLFGQPENCLGIEKSARGFSDRSFPEKPLGLWMSASRCCFSCPTISSAWPKMLASFVRRCATQENILCQAFVLQPCHPKKLFPNVVQPETEYHSSKRHYGQRNNIVELVMHLIVDTDTDKIFWIYALVADADIVALCSFEGAA